MSTACMEHIPTQRHLRKMSPHYLHHHQKKVPTIHLTLVLAQSDISPSAWRLSAQSDISLSTWCLSLHSQTSVHLMPVFAQSDVIHLMPVCTVWHLPIHLMPVFAQSDISVLVQSDISLSAWCLSWSSHVFPSVRQLTMHGLTFVYQPDICPYMVWHLYLPDTYPLFFSPSVWCLFLYRATFPPCLMSLHWSDIFASARHLSFYSPTFLHQSWHLFISQTCIMHSLTSSAASPWSWTV